MDEVFDILTRLSLEVNDKSLDEHIARMQKAAGKIEELKQKERDLAKTISDAQKANHIDTNEQQRISNLILQQQRLKTAIEAKTIALQNDFNANKKLQAAIKEEAGAIDVLIGRLKRLKEERNSLSKSDSNYQREINDRNREIASVERQLKQLTSYQRPEQGYLESLKERGSRLSTIREQLPLSDPQYQSRLTKLNDAIRTTNDEIGHLTSPSRLGAIRELEDRIKSLTLSRDKVPSSQPGYESAIKKYNQEIKEGQQQLATFKGNPKFEEALKKEQSLIGSLTLKLEELRRKRDEVSKHQVDAKEVIQGYNRQIADVQKELNGLTGAGGGKGGVLSSIFGGGNNILQGILFGTGFGIANRAASYLREFVVEGGRLAAQMETVKVAFDNLNNPGFLDNLRKATKGTVSDLELMKKAVYAAEFNIPLERLPQLLEFARTQALKLGRDVDDFTDRIINGINRQSIKLLDDLGLSAKEIREEYKRTGDFAQGVMNIIDRKYKDVGDRSLTLVEIQQQYNAEIQNSQTQIGKLLQEFQAFGYAYALDFKEGKGFGPFFVMEDSRTARLRKMISEDIPKAEEEAARTRNAIQVIYNEKYKTLVEEFVKTDAAGRKSIISAAEEMTNGLIEKAKRAYGESSKEYLKFVELITSAADLASKTIVKKASDYSLSDINSGTLTRDVISWLKDENRRNLFSAKDSDLIKMANERDAALQKQLDIIDGKKEKTREKSQTTRINQERNIEKEILEMQKRTELARLAIQENSYEKIERINEIELETGLSKYDEEIKALKEKGIYTEKLAEQYERLREATREYQEAQKQVDEKQFGEFIKELERTINFSNLQKELQNIETHISLPNSQASVKAEIDAAEMRREIADMQAERDHDEAVKNLKKDTNLLSDIDYDAEVKKLNDNLSLADKEYYDHYKVLIARHKQYVNQKELIDAQYQKELDLNKNKFEQEQGDAFIKTLEKEIQQIESAYSYLKVLQQGEDYNTLVNDREDALNGKRVGRYMRRRDRQNDKSTLAQDALDVKMYREELEKAEKAYNDLKDAQQKGQPVTEKSINDSFTKVGELQDKLSQAENQQIEDQARIKAKRQETVHAAIEGFQTILNAGVQAADMLYQHQINLLDREAAIRKERVDYAVTLAERGNVDILNSERAKLEGAQEASEKYTRKQQQMNAILTASNQALALSQALVAIANAGTGDPYTAAARIIAVAAALGVATGLVTSIISAAKISTGEGFYEGDYTGDGNPRDVAGVVHKKEFVFDHKATERIGVERLRALREGRVGYDMLLPTNEIYEHTGRNNNDYKELKKELALVREAIEANKVSVSQRMDKRGISQAIETFKEQEEFSFRG